jgi:hypothetical protein
VRPDALDPGNPRRQLRSQQAIVGRFDRQFRTAVIRTLIEIGPSLRASRTTRHAVTVAFVNPAGRSSFVNQAMNSSNPRLYTRRVIGDDTLSSTSAFNRRHSKALSATTKAFIIKSFISRYLAISGANRTLALVAGDIKLCVSICSTIANRRFDQ